MMRSRRHESALGGGGERAANLEQDARAPRLREPRAPALRVADADLLE